MVTPHYTLKRCRCSITNKIERNVRLLQTIFTYIFLNYSPFILCQKSRGFVPWNPNIHGSKLVQLWTMNNEKMLNNKSNSKHNTSILIRYSVLTMWTTESTSLILFTANVTNQLTQAIAMLWTSMGAVEYFRSHKDEECDIIDHFGNDVDGLCRILLGRGAAILTHRGLSKITDISLTSYSNVNYWILFWISLHFVPYSPMIII